MLSRSKEINNKTANVGVRDFPYYISYHTHYNNELIDKPKKITKMFIVVYFNHKMLKIYIVDLKRLTMVRKHRFLPIPLKWEH